MEMSRKDQLKSILAYGLMFFLWAISLPVAGWVILDVRDTILTVLAVISAKRVQSGTAEAFYANLRLRAADTTSYLFVGIALVIVVVVIENIYRSGMFTDRLWKRFFLVWAVCFGLLALNGLVKDLARSAIDAFTWRGLFGPAVYSVLAVFFFVIGRSKRLPNNPKPNSLIQY